MMVMKRNICPACGASGYLGRRCGKCLYVPFQEEIAHGNHYDQGEPLVVRSAMGMQKIGKYDCPTDRRYQRKAPSSFKLVWIIVGLACLPVAVALIAAAPGLLGLAVVIGISLLRKRRKNE